MTETVGLQTAVVGFLAERGEEDPDVTVGEWVSVDLAYLPFVTAFDRVPWDGETLALLGRDGRWRPVTLTLGQCVICRKVAA